MLFNLLRMNQLMHEEAAGEGRSGIKIMGQQDLTGRRDIDGSDLLAMSPPGHCRWNQCIQPLLSGEPHTHLRNTPSGLCRHKVSHLIDPIALDAPRRALRMGWCMSEHERGEYNATGHEHACN